ncbi:hypothetical protein AKG37_17545 [Bacillus australimaris]|uniref:Lipoprotein n=1 Tax=Bacillus australimaris TaxID=1326968 RepID=A0ABD4QFX7_9BACI|nr:hypothetical protein [Bacillus australimaris]KPN14932.1 hypothetical protein AKG37_17545 [Bacillus australimaris]MBR8689357.1 hypothetical protein [Bacillus australimaris]
MKKSLLVFMSLVASLVILAACSNTTKEQKTETKALPTINERIQKETKEVMEQSKLIKDTDITVDQKKKVISLNVTASSDTNSDYAEVIGLNFAKTLAIGASTEKENNLHKPENDSLGALYSFYDLNITVKQANGKVLAQGKKTTNETRITWERAQ